MTTAKSAMISLKNLKFEEQQLRLVFTTLLSLLTTRTQLDFNVSVFLSHLCRFCPTTTSTTRPSQFCLHLLISSAAYSDCPPPRFCRIPRICREQKSICPRQKGPTAKGKRRSGAGKGEISL